MTISTHVLDTSAGRPGAGIHVRLFRRDGSSWTLLSEETTNADGRVPALVPADVVVEPGEYRLAFDVDVYFAARRQDSFYTTIEIAFVVRESAQHYHVPLLLSPYGYSTYRGS
jgi:5-hydroxyisourate hydrolase